MASNMSSPKPSSTVGRSPKTFQPDVVSSVNGNSSTGDSKSKRSQSLTPATVRMVNRQRRKSFDNPESLNEKVKEIVSARRRSGILPEATVSDITSAVDQSSALSGSQATGSSVQSPIRLYTTIIYERPIVYKPLRESTVGEENPDPEKATKETDQQKEVEAASDADKWKPPSSMFGIDVFSLPIGGLRAASNGFFAKPTRRQIESVSELKPKSAAESLKSKNSLGGGNSEKTESQTSESANGQQSPSGSSRIPRFVVRSVSTKSLGVSAGRSSKLLVSSEALKRREAMISKMVSAVEKKQTSVPSEEAPPPVLFTNFRVNLTAEDEETDAVTTYFGNCDTLLPLPEFDRVLNEVQSNLRVESAININIVRLLKRQAKIIYRSKASEMPPRNDFSIPSYVYVRQSSEQTSKGNIPLKTTGQLSSGRYFSKTYPHDAQPSVFYPSMSSQESRSAAPTSLTTSAQEDEEQKMFNFLVKQLVAKTMGELPSSIDAISISASKESQESTAAGDGDDSSRLESWSKELLPKPEDVRKLIVDKLAEEYAQRQSVSLRHPSIEKPRGSRARKTDRLISTPLQSSESGMEDNDPSEDKKWSELFTFAVASVNGAMEGIRKKSLAKETIMQVTVRDPSNDLITPLMVIKAQLLPTPAAFAKASLVPLTTLVPVQSISHLHQISEMRYVERGVWIQHFADKIREVEIEVGPPEIEIESTTDRPSSASSSQSRTESTVVLMAESAIPGSSLGASLKNIEVSIDRDHYESRLLPLIGYLPSLSTAEEEKAEELPGSPIVSSASDTENTRVSGGHGLFSASDVSSVSNFVPSPERSALHVGVGSEREWNLSPENVDIREFIAEMMHPLPPLMIDTVDMYRSNVQFEWVFVDEKGNITSAAAKSTNGGLK